MRDLYDIIVVGGGPVGLHAALKAAVLRQTVLVIDKGRAFARAAQAPAYANIPGLAGISGIELIDRLRKDLEVFADLSGEQLVRVLDETEAYDARREEDGTFVVRTRGPQGEREARGRVLVLATGFVDRKPGIEQFHRKGHETLAPFLHRGEIGYCVLCEGWNLRDREVAVVGSSTDSVQIAVDVARHFEGRVTLLTDGAQLEGEDSAERLREEGIALDERPIDRYEEVAEGRVRVALAEGGAREFEKLMFSLGNYRVNNELAVILGGAVTPEGYVRTDANSEVVDRDGKRIPGLFAVGDVRAGRWKQVVVGWGDAETAVITAYAKRLPD